MESEGRWPRNRQGSHEFAISGGPHKLHAATVPNTAPQAHVAHVAQVTHVTLTCSAVLFFGRLIRADVSAKDDAAGRARSGVPMCRPSGVVAFV